MEKPCYRRKTPLVVGGTQTQVLADSIDIAASIYRYVMHITMTCSNANLFCSYIFMTAAKRSTFLGFADCDTVLKKILR